MIDLSTTDPGDLFRGFPALIDRFFVVEFPNVCFKLPNGLFVIKSKIGISKIL